jgi:tRNA-Thr(GGU) m(6)t(6)A37 methyltransferase TsaA
LTDDRYELQVIGRIESPITDRSAAARQGDEGAPDATLVVDPRFADGARDIQVGDEILVLTWLDRAHREVMIVRPRKDPRNPLTGVFSTRSPDRPNPIGLHRVPVLAVDGLRIRVANMEAIDGTPLVDIKPVLDRERDR